MDLDMEEQRRADHTLVAVTGALDLDSAPALCARLKRLRSVGDGDVVLDLSGLDFCDSTGLRALIGEAREAGIAGARLRIVPPDDGSARRLFELTGAEQLLPLRA